MWPIAERAVQHIVGRRVRRVRLEVLQIEEERLVPARRELIQPGARHRVHVLGTILHEPLRIARRLLAEERLVRVEPLSVPVAGRDETVRRERRRRVATLLQHLRQRDFRRIELRGGTHDAVLRLEAGGE